MKFSTILLLVLVALCAAFGTAEAGWIKKQLKKAEKGVRRVRDRARENLDVVAGYTGVAAQAGLLPGK
ncbi:unnamed protein product [Ceutorhynchus assimilis]|uniref:Uncharacterized protein n=1 Tax=Ceutorhynchus assimilis TaxID=467358 RepID=A0A9N9MSY5_9CUCU|nr:unnamed protein product [Ceutorhynchus assimilis]